MNAHPVRQFLSPRRPWLWLICLLLIYQLLGALILPMVLKQQLIKISAERTQLQTEIDLLKFDPYTFRLYMEGLYVRDAQNRSLLAFDSLDINLAPTGYLRGKILQVQSVDLDGLAIYLERNSEGLTNVQQVIDNWFASAPPVDQQASDTETETTEAPAIQVDRFSLNGAQLSLSDQLPTTPFALLLQDVQFSLDGFNSLSEQPASYNASLAVSSGGRLHLDGTIALMPVLTAQTRVGIESLSLALLQPYIADSTQLELVEALLSLQAEIRSNAEDSLAYQGSLKIDNLDIQYDQQQLLGWQSLQLPENSFNLDEQRLELSEINLDQAFARIIIDREGGTNISQALTSDANPRNEPTTADAEPAEAPEPAETDTPFTLRVGQISIENAAMYFADFSLPLPFATDISNLQGKVSTITNNSSEPASLDLAGQVGEFGLVNIGGDLRPLDPKDLTNIDLIFENIDMIDLSPYLIKFAGRTIASGKLDVDLGYRIAASQLEGSNKVVLREFTLGESVDSPDAINLPLGLALALLKNSQGVIDIDLPVQGDLDKPEFNYGKVVRSALVNLLTNIVSSPFRLLGGLVGSDLPLDQIEFEAGSAEVLAPQREKLINLANALTERPQLALEIPAYYNLSLDTAALRQQSLVQRLTSLLPENTSADSPERREVLQGFYLEAFGPDSLEALRLQYSSTAELDNLAFANHMQTELIPVETLQPDALDNLARNRAQNIQAAIQAAQSDLAQRLVISNETEDSATESDSRVSLKLDLQSL